MLRCTSSSLFVATPLLAGVVRGKAYVRPKYHDEARDAPTLASKLASGTRRLETRPLSKHTALSQKFGRRISIAQGSEDYKKWFLETYGVDLNSDAGCASGCPTLSNSSTISLEASENLDKALMDKNADYPAEEMSEEIRRIQRLRALGIGH